MPKVYNMENKSILIVSGTFDEKAGKASYYGQKIYETFNQVFGDCIEYINGGMLSALDNCFSNISQYKIILWMPNIDNSVDKYLPRIKVENKTATLIQTKRNDTGEYTTFDLIERMFKAHSNLCLEIKKIKDSDYAFRVLDPLGNLWYIGMDISKAAYRMALMARYLRSLTRVPSVRDLEEFAHMEIEDDFIEAVKNYSWRFTRLIKSAISKERFLGNASTRCMRGFPSIKQENRILVTQRNVDKAYLNKDNFVEVMLNGQELMYHGSNKPSVDASIHVMLFGYYKRVNYIIHGHTYAQGAPYTKQYVPCGYLEEFLEIIKVFPNYLKGNFAVNLRGHGCLIFAQDIDYLASVGLSDRPFPENLSNDTFLERI